MTATTIARTWRLTTAFALALAACAAGAQPDTFAAERTVTITVASVASADGQVLAERGGRYAVDRDTVLEFGADERIHGAEILGVLQPGMPLRLHLAPDGGDPPVIERMVVETR